MKKQIFILTVVFIFSGLNAQQDPEAKKILDQAAEKTRSFKSLQTSFKLIIEDRKENTKNESSGKIKIKGEKYLLESMGSTVFYDGKTMWTYVKENEEVTITEPDMNDDDFLSNPAKILTWYNRDFKYRYVGEEDTEGKTMHEIDLFPNDLNQPYSRIKLFIGVNDLLLYSVKSSGKDGIDYSVKLSDYILNQEISDSQFIFDPSKYKKAEVIDMRL